MYDILGCMSDEQPKRRTGFQPGHPQYASPARGSVPAGRSASIYRAAGQIARAIDLQLPMELVVDWHMFILAGMTPILVRDSSDSPWRVEHAKGEPSTTHDQRARAMDTLLNRRLGMPMQSVAIEAEVKAIHAVGSVAGQLSPAGVINVLRAIRAAKTPVLPASTTTTAAARPIPPATPAGDQG